LVFEDPTTRGGSLSFGAFRSEIWIWHPGITPAQNDSNRLKKLWKEENN
jgi:hypothetical protein